MGSPSLLRPLGLFVTGTDTGVGKTEVTTRIIRAGIEAGLNVGAYKPACSGVEVDHHGKAVWGDIERLVEACCGKYSGEQVCSQRFRAPLAPPAAAAAEGAQVDLDQIEAGFQWWSDQVELLVVEGAGGWFCPLTEHCTFAELATRWQFPVVIVAANRLGVINHTLLTIAAVRRCGLTVAAVVLNDVQPEADASAGSNLATLARYANVQVLAHLGYGGEVIRARGASLTGLNWKQLAGG